MNDELTYPDSLYFQQASMLLLVFRFRGRRKLVASRLMETPDFAAELEAHAPILDRHYGDLEVSAVDVVSYQHGRFYTDTWSDGAALLERLREPVDRSGRVDEANQDEATENGEDPDIDDDVTNDVAATA